MFDDIIYTTINNESGWDQTMAIDELATEGTLPSEMVSSEIESNWSDSLDTDLTNEVESNWSESLDTDLTNEIDSNWSEILDTDLTNEIESNWSDSLDTDLTNEVESNSTQSLDTDVTNEIESNWSDSLDTDVTHEVDSNSTQSLDTDVTNQVETNSTQSLDTDVTNQVETNSTQSLDTDATHELATDTVNQSESKIHGDENLDTEAANSSATEIAQQPETASSEAESEASVSQETELTNQSATDSWQETTSKMPVEDTPNAESANSETASPELWSSDELLNKLEELDSIKWYHHRTSWPPNEAFNGVGEPHLDAKFWQPQTDPASCAVVTQLEVYESLKGVKLPEEAICQVAEANGWYDPNTGTPQHDVGKVLEACGVETEQTYDATLVDIYDALERGDKVIVALDGNEIWHPLRDASTSMPIEQPADFGHTVWVTGIHQSQDGSIKIFINDTVTTDGQMKVVDALDFLNAWNDFGNHLVVAKAPMT